MKVCIALEMNAVNNETDNALIPSSIDSMKTLAI